MPAEQQNPFRPDFGVRPPVLAGREDLIKKIRSGLAAGPSHRYFTNLLVGPRGTGKTVLLDVIQDRAQRDGWLIVDEESSNPGLIDRLRQAAISSLTREDGRSLRNKIKSIKAWIFGVEFRATAVSSYENKTLRHLLTKLTNRTRKRPGVLLTVDELHIADLATIRELGAVLQFVTKRGQLPLAFLGAALPDIEDKLFTDNGSTYLQRMSRLRLGELSDSSAAEAFQGGFEAGGVSISREVLEDAVKLAGGNPFMIQLLGFHCWEVADTPYSEVLKAHLDKALPLAHYDLGENLLWPMWRSLSEVNKEFLKGAVDEDDATRSHLTIAGRIGVDEANAESIRDKLAHKGFITAENGAIKFVHEYAQEWIKARK